jgi:ferritin-like metal-binding protein YciE
MQLDNLRDLFVHQLKDLHSAESQLVKALPKMIERARSTELRQALESHLGETKEHVSRLETVLEAFDANGRSPKCKGMQGLIAEGKEVLSSAEDAVIDAGLIAAAQRVEHYEIAAYGTVRSFAETLGESEAASILERTLEEEKAADAVLTEIATAAANSQAAGSKARPAPTKNR